MSSIKGKVIFCSEIETVGQNNMEKRTFAIETDGQYPQQIGFELIKEHVGKVSPSDVGKICEVSYNLRGREYNGKYYVNLSAWKVDMENNDSDAGNPF